VATLKIDVAPVAAQPPFQLDSTRYFSDLHGALLEPFRRKMRIMPRVTTSSTNNRALVQSVIQEISQDKSADADYFLDSWIAGKAKDTQLFQTGKDNALNYWARVRKESDEAHQSGSWSRLIQQDGPLFVGKIAELYYTLNFNIALIGLQWMEGGDVEVFLGVQKALENLNNTWKKNYWGIAHSWTPTQVQKVKESRRYTTFIRLWGLPDGIPYASATIDASARTNPNDAAVQAEKRKIDAWKERAGRP
jgi:hypothetical protein